MSQLQPVTCITVFIIFKDINKMIQTNKYSVALDVCSKQGMQLNTSYLIGLSKLLLAAFWRNSSDKINITAALELLA